MNSMSQYFKVQLGIATTTKNQEFLGACKFCIFLSSTFILQWHSSSSSFSISSNSYNYTVNLLDLLELPICPKFLPENSACQDSFARIGTCNSVNIIYTCKVPKLKLKSCLSIV